MEEPEVSLRRSGRRIQFPKCLVDFLPSMATPLTHIPSRQPAAHHDPDPPLEALPSQSPECSPPIPPTVTWINTMPNQFGLFRSYPARPTMDPEAGQSLDSVCDSPALATPSNAPLALTSMVTLPAPIAEPVLASTVSRAFANCTTELLLGWHYSGSTLKSAGEFDRLVQILLHPEFDLKDLVDVSFACETKKLDTHLANPENALHERDGWIRSSVDIHMPPVDKQSAITENESPTFTVSGIYHRRLVNIITTTYSSPIFRTFHLTPFRQYWHLTPESPPISLYSEVYSSTAMIEAHQKVTEMPCIGPDDHHECVVAPLMLW